MKSLAESAPHTAKRRKVAHGAADEEIQPLSSMVIAPDTTTSQVEEGKEEGDEGVVKDIDHVDEPEDDPANAPLEELSDDDDEPDASDPFETHFSAPNDEYLAPRLKAAKEDNWRTERTAANNTRIVLNTPDTGGLPDGQSFPKPISTITDINLKKKLSESLSSKNSKFGPVEQTIAPYIFNYQDTLYCNRTVAGGQNVRRMACLHALNHVFKYVH
jgi:U3 small nucleolar RNA-associated protein 25